MTLVSTESAVEGMRRNVLNWCSEQDEHSRDHPSRKVIEAWMDDQDDQTLAALIGTTEDADEHATISMAELGARAYTCTVPLIDVSVQVTRLLEGPANLPAARVCLLRGAFLGAVSAEVTGARIARRRRHDVTSPLQAAMLNLELTMIEHEADAELLAALTSIKGSLDQAVQLLSHNTSTDNGML